MKVLVDTSVWSLALRRRSVSDAELRIVDELSGLIQDSRVAILGQIRQELLSGISSEKTFNILREKLSAFDDLPVDTDTYELAARFCNTCRRKGVQGSHVDFFICAAASRNGIPIFTLDNDFNNYSKYIGIEMYGWISK
ncbi:type II toxin-antitoxin system VapC family toxin [Limisalsivibrio acetivorans]|uniref:type II toxin-antitoxin system VapC family toxin n=1 Tax=Limisalsivibrio acetivorans TaxID=1304888 RepID=UPI0003B6BC7C|nr:PIN domain-containing protein [Limisalsivibrio acetivorans]